MKAELQYGKFRASVVHQRELALVVGQKLCCAVGVDAALNEHTASELIFHALRNGVERRRLTPDCGKQIGRSSL